MTKLTVGPFFPDTENDIFNDVTIRHHYVVSCKYDGTFYNFSVTRIVRMIRAKNYQQFCKFVKVTGENTVGPFIAGDMVYSPIKEYWNLVLFS